MAFEPENVLGEVTLVIGPGMAIQSAETTEHSEENREGVG